MLIFLGSQPVIALRLPEQVPGNGGVWSLLFKDDITWLLPSK